MAVCDGKLKWIEQNRQPNTQYILSLSYGKDSIAMIEACRQLHYPLDRIVTAEVWATDTIPADLPPMVEFKEKADRIIKERYGLTVEHVCAMRPKKDPIDGTQTNEMEKLTYEKMFYHIPKRKVNIVENYQKKTNDRGKLPDSHLSQLPVTLGSNKELYRSGIYTGFPCANKGWCHDLKPRERNGFLGMREFLSKRQAQGAKINIVQYLGIAADEPERIKRHSKPGFALPLVEIGWDEAYCRKWCEENDLLSPIYKTAARGGCWFCHNQRVDQLRILRKDYPEYWKLLLKWDLDSPITFKSNHTTVHDFDKRFEMEDKGILTPGDRRFRWNMINNPEKETHT